jgi:hypothetical protein
MEADFMQAFKIPGKVQDRKHFITDELTEVEVIPCSVNKHVTDPSRVVDTHIQ